MPSAPSPPVKGLENQGLENRFRQVFHSFEQDWSVAELSLQGLYHADVEFQDPLVHTKGRPAFLRTSKVLWHSAKSIKIDVTSVVAKDDSLFANWTFSLTPRLGPTLHVEGCSYASVKDDQIISQRDYWDILGSVAKSVPGVRLARQQLENLSEKVPFLRKLNPLS